MLEGVKERIGVVGSGFIASGLIHSLENKYSVNSVLTRRAVESLNGQGKYATNSTNEFLDKSDIVIECSGDPIHATPIVEQALTAGKRVITMDAELQTTTGYALSKLGYITEAEGDQPGCLAALDREARAMGFRPAVYGNIKGFLNHTPNPEEMAYWANKSGISLTQVTSFTDGTKINIEQVLVANGMNATILDGGMAGIKTDDFQQGANELGQLAKGQVISDYLLCPKAPPGVFIVAEHDAEQEPYLRYYKMGTGPFYLLVKPFHLCHLEILKTLNEVLAGGSPLLQNRDNKYSVAAIAKHDIEAGTEIKQGIGSFDFRGVAIKRESDHFPIGLIQNAVATRNIKSGDLVRFNDIETPYSRAMEMWLS